MQIKIVNSIKATAEADVFLVDCVVETDSQEDQLLQTVRLDDPYGASPVIRQWMTDNPDFPIDPYTPVPESLAAIKANLKSLIDTAAEDERLKYITGGAGQALTYSQKADEATRYLAAVAAGETPEPAGYPLLSAEIGITAPTIGEVAAVVNTAFSQWQQIGALIEAAPLGTKAAIEAAATAAEAQAAANGVVWPAA